MHSQHDLAIHTECCTLQHNRTSGHLGGRASFKSPSADEETKKETKKETVKTGLGEIQHEKEEI